MEYVSGEFLIFKVMLQYITLNTSWERLTVDDSITFHTPDGSFYRYIIANTLSSTYFCHAECGQNQIIFYILEIDAENFVKNVVGYIGVGSWPEVKTIDDLKKVIKALDDECIKKWGMPNQNVSPYNLKNGDYIKIISTKSDMSFIYLFKEMQRNRIWRHASYDLKHRISNVYPRYWLFNDNTKITYATEEEKKLLDNALLEKGYIWNNLTKQLDSIDSVNIDLTNTCSNGIIAQPVDVSSFRDSIERVHDMFVDSLSCAKEEPQTETELNLFPEKKHYQLNFNY